MEGLDDIVGGLQWRDREVVKTHHEDGVAIGAIEHPETATEQPVEIDQDRSLWVWGVILGHEWDGTYQKKPEALSGPAFVARVIESYGLPGIAGLNSEFVGGLLDESDRTLTLFSDRLGSRPLYLTRTGNDSVAFAPIIQAIGRHRDISLSFDPPMVSEFLHYHRSVGVDTPLREVTQLPPGSVVTMSMEGTIQDEWAYWWPKPISRSRTYEEAVDRLAGALAEAVNDRVYPDQTGLFLSGGVDSRAILAVLETPVTAFHFNEQLSGNREAQLAHRAARRTGTDFEFLKREIDHYPNVLSATETLTNYNGYFRVANHLGFEERMSDQVTHVLNGQYSDTLIGPTYVPMTDGAPRSIRSPEAYTKAFEHGEMSGHANNLPFVQELPNPADVLREHLHEGDESIEVHGVSYPSWEALVEFGMVYPITNVRSFIWYETQVQCFPTQYPFFDNRVLDVILGLPPAYRYQYDLKADVLEHLDPGLANLETVRDHPYRYHLANSSPRQVLDDLAKVISVHDGAVTYTAPDSHLRPTSGFPHTAGLIRSHPFLKNLFEAHRTEIDTCPYLDWDALMECLDSHKGGENYTDRLFGVASMVVSEAFGEAYAEHNAPGIGHTTESAQD